MNENPQFMNDIILTGITTLSGGAAGTLFSNLVTSKINKKARRDQLRLNIIKTVDRYFAILKVYALNRNEMEIETRMMSLYEKLDGASRKEKEKQIRLWAEDLAKSNDKTVYSQITDAQNELKVLLEEFKVHRPRESQRADNLLGELQTAAEGEKLLAEWTKRNDWTYASLYNYRRDSYAEALQVVFREIEEAHEKLGKEVSDLIKCL